MTSTDARKREGVYSTQVSEMDDTPRGDKKFTLGPEGQGYVSKRGRQYNTDQGNRQDVQDEFGANVDEKRHHMKSDNTPDMRFKENREEFTGEGYEYSTSQRRREDGNNQIENIGNYDNKGHHLKSDGTPDMRFKENREEFSGEGYENTTTRATGSQPKSGRQGEFSGGYDTEGHHLKSDGRPDMRFKENREEFSGKGFEGRGSRSSRRTSQQGGRSKSSGRSFGQQRGTQNYDRNTQGEGNQYRTSGQKYGSSQSSSGRNIQNKSGRQGEFSGQYDKKGHHLKSDGTPDMRFKENREEFEGQGYEYTTSRPKPTAREMEESQDRPNDYRNYRTPRKENAYREQNRTGKDQYQEESEKFRYLKEGSSGTSSKRKFQSDSSRNKDNRQDNQNRQESMIDEKATPGKHSGKFDQKGRHLKSDGSLDYRYRENQEHESTGRQSSRNSRQDRGYQGYSLNIRSNSSNRRANLRDKQFNEAPYRSNENVTMDDEQEKDIENSIHYSKDDQNKVRYGGGYMNKRTSQGFQNKYQPKFKNEGFEEQSEDTYKKSKEHEEQDEGQFRREGKQSEYNRRSDDEDEGDTGRQGRSGNKSNLASSSQNKQGQSKYSQGQSQNQTQDRSQGESSQKQQEGVDRFYEQSEHNRETRDRLGSISTIDEDFDELLMDIDLKRPRRAFNYFIVEMKDKEKADNLIDITRKYGQVWRNMPQRDKEPYEEKARKDEKRFKETLDIVRDKILSRDIEQVSAKQVFLDERCRTAIEMGKDIRKERENSRNDWRNLSDSKKDEYEHKKQLFESFYEELKNPNKLTGENIFIRDIKIIHIENSGETLSTEEAIKEWKSTSDKLKQKYNEYANLIREEIKQQRSGIILASGVKPRRPLGPYRLFMAKLADEGAFKNKKVNVFQETARIWKSLTDQEKEKYNIISQRERVEYNIRKMEFIQELRKTYGKARTSFNLYVRNIRDEIKDMTFEPGRVFEVLYDKWKHLPEEERKKYDQMAEDEKFESEKRREYIKNKLTGNVKKRTPTPYAIYIRENASQMKKDNPNMDMKFIFKKLGEDWNSMSEEDHDIYYKKYEKELNQSNQKNISGVYKTSPNESTKKGLGNSRNTIIRTN